MTKKALEEKDAKGYSLPLYTEDEALALPITLPNGNRTTIGACSDEEFVTYIEAQVRSFAGANTEAVVTGLLGKYYKYREHDDSARWYAAIELPNARRDHKRMLSQKAYERAKAKQRAQKRGAA